MRRVLLLSLFAGLHVLTAQVSLESSAWRLSDFPQTPCEVSQFNHTATVSQAKEWYAAMQSRFPDRCSLLEMGPSDAAEPVPVFVISAKQPNPIRVLVNNAIHPGEPEGVDACMAWVRDKLLAKGSAACDRVEYHIVLHYNVGGSLNRNAHTRANQDGPEVYGFRGNSQNLDLNRDFIKMDSREAWTFARYFAQNRFDYFIDNHTSNGADYQYALTFFSTHPDKLHPTLRPLSEHLETSLRADLNERNWINAPYVQTQGRTPETGLVGFFETGRYATGYAALHHCIGICVETHMLKPFPERVRATLAFLQAFSDQLAASQFQDFHDSTRQRLQQQFSSHPWIQAGDYCPIRYELDEQPSDSLLFHGFAHGYKPSEVHGAARLYYDRSQPLDFTVPYWNHYRAVDSARVPLAYILPRGYAREVQERLSIQPGVKLRMIPVDTVIALTASHLLSMKTSQEPYEGHYLHSQIQTQEYARNVQVHRGDWIIPVTPENALFLMNVLEPRAPDSYFAWNFFDACLQRKEWFSDYVFEDWAAEQLELNEAFKEAYDRAKQEHPEWEKNPYQALSWLYEKGPLSEPWVKEIPVYRLF